MNGFDDHGFVLLNDVLSDGEIAEVAIDIEAIPVGEAAGVRNLASVVPCVAKIAKSDAIATLLECLRLPGAFLVRSILFDKQPGTNWKVAWHQDLTIAVRQRREVAGFGPWSIKDGVAHVRPPAAVLECMVTLRIHLDDCPAENGALRVLPESHKYGILGPEQIKHLRRGGQEATCEAKRGGILAMRPLLLHASSPARLLNHRRVIHLEFANAELPGGLAWHCGRAH